MLPLLISTFYEVQPMQKAVRKTNINMYVSITFTDKTFTMFCNYTVCVNSFQFGSNNASSEHTSAMCRWQQNGP